MIRNPIILSVEEADMILQLIGFKSLDELKKFSPQLLNFLNEFRSIVREEKYSYLDEN